MTRRRSRTVSRVPALTVLLPLVMFFSFLVALFFTGGSARSDQSGVLILRPLAVVFTGVSLFFMGRTAFQTVKGPLLLLAGLAALIALQLVPLPPTIWSLFPGRSGYMEIFEALQLEAPWLPITHFPVRTWNSLVSLVVPLAALTTYAILQRRHKDLLVALLIGFGILSAVLGFMQVLSGGDRALYLYSIANFKSNCGFFANRNHQAVFQVGVLLLIPYARMAYNRNRVQPYALNMLAVAMIGLLVFSIFTTGSRIGFALGLLAAIWSGWKIYGLIDASEKSDVRFAREKFSLSARAQKRVVPVLILAIALAALVAPRSLVLDRLVSDDAEAPIEDMRVNILKNSLDMIPDNLPFGGGAGTFPDVYKGYESADNISYRYVNHAHNDLLELVYELGILGIVLLLLCLLLLGKWAVAAKRAGDDEWEEVKPMLGILLVFFIASLFDYPARTPIGASFLSLIVARIYIVGTTTKGLNEARQPE